MTLNYPFPVTFPFDIGQAESMERLIFLFATSKLFGTIVHTNLYIKSRSFPYKAQM